MFSYVRLVHRKFCVSREDERFHCDVGKEAVNLMEFVSYEFNYIYCTSVPFLSLSQKFQLKVRQALNFSMLFTYFLTGLSDVHD